MKGTDVDRGFVSKPKRARTGGNLTRLPPRSPVRLLAKLLTRCTPTFQIRLARSVANTTKTV